MPLYGLIYLKIGEMFAILSILLLVSSIHGLSRAFTHKNVYFETYKRECRCDVNV